MKNTRRPAAMVAITARRLRRYEAAENVARAFRKAITMRADAPAEEREERWNTAGDWLCYWLEFSTTEHGKPPAVPPVPARWKYNRDQAMRGWPDRNHPEIPESSGGER